MKELLLAVIVYLSVAQGMPLVLDESHAATFGAVARYLPLDEPYRLLLLDAHCDANEPAGVEELQQGIRRVTSEKQRVERVQGYRRAGRIQAYNWLVPLMPRPVAQVYWLAPYGAKNADALEYLPLRLAGSWRDVKSWQDLPRDDDLPWVATIDLDAFALAPDPLEALRDAWLRVLRLPRLRLVTVCASTPWQKSPQQSQALFDEAVSLARRTHPAEVIVNSDVDDAPDTSRRASEHGGIVPRVQMPSSVPPPLAIRAEEDGRLTLHPDNNLDVTWIRLEPHATCANLLTHLSEGKAFSGGLAPSALLWRATRRLSAADGQLAADHVPLGVSWWQAEVPSGQRSAVTRVNRSEGTGMHAALSALLGTPYMFGAGLVTERAAPVAAAGWGNDCANFLASAARDCGARVLCVCPAQLRGYLQPYEGGAFVDLVYHADNHVAALWRDEPPLGQWGPEDLLVHHLGGMPEVLSRAEFERRYPRARYETFIWKRQPLMLAAVGDVSPSPGGVAGLLPPADLVLANLEGSVEARGDRPRVRFPQLAPPGRVAELLRGIDCVSLANNHAGDGGRQGLDALCRELDRAGIRYVGVGRDPVILEKNGVRVAVWGTCGRVPDNISEWRDRVDQLVVMVHWGEEMQPTPNREQRDLAVRLAAKGVDVVFGSHPHVWQSPFNVGLTRIYPSLGNWRFKLAPGVPAFNERSSVMVPLGPRHARGMEQFTGPCTRSAARVKVSTSPGAKADSPPD